MKLLAQHMRTGETLLMDTPAPQLQPGTLLVKTRKSLVSKGTEHSLIEFSQSSLIGKALRHPNKAAVFWEKLKSEGVSSTVRQAWDTLDQVLPLGYCNVGEVIAIGEGVRGFQVGDLVASNGPHAEVVRVSASLAAKVPQGVSTDEAAFTVLGSVALQGLRLLAPALGETIVVFGLGLIGQLTAGLLLINGCRVIGIEPSTFKRELAAKKGIITVDPESVDSVKKVLALTGGIGADGVIIAASSADNEIMSASAGMTRKRGKIVLIGNVGLHLNRADFYKKEITFQVSCSYGPGRYDHLYEEKNIDYPLPFVRWTENRNFQSILRLLETRSLDVASLISGILPIEKAAELYANTSEETLATLIEYPLVSERKNVREVRKINFLPTDVVIGIVGAGHYTRQTLLPNLNTKTVKYIASASGITSERLGRKYRIPYAVSGYRDMLDDPELDLVMITTRHGCHAQMVVDALGAGKHVFVEKPLALSLAELTDIIDTYHSQKNPRMLSVGFNRRFSPHVCKIKKLLANDPVNVIITVNAAGLSETTWLDDPEVGGGRIIGEACHFIDLAAHIAGSPIEAVCMNQNAGAGVDANLLLRFANGSSAVINYLSNGHPGYSKERIEIYSLGRTLVLDDFKNLKGYGFKNFSSLRTKRSKGHHEQFQLLLERLKKGGEALIPFEELINTTRATFGAIESYQQNAWVEI